MQKNRKAKKEHRSVNQAFCGLVSEGLGAKGFSRGLSSKRPQLISVEASYDPIVERIYHGNQQTKEN
jgi:hypothetical protein